MRRALALVLVSLLGACVLAVSPREYGGTCRFGSKETACAACVRSTCRLAVDGCCRSDACAGTLTLLDGCADGDPAACRTLDLARTSDDLTISSLASCVDTACREACPVGVVASATRCDRPLSGPACSCLGSVQSNTVECSAAAFPGTICCADPAYPKVGTRCECRTLGCGPSNSGCLCGLFDQTSTQHDCGGTHCCAKADTCACGPDPCNPDETAVSGCAIEAIACPEGKTAVDRCSIAR